MEKYAFKMRLSPGAEAEYRKRHDEIWPELVTLLKEAGVSDYSIHLDAETDTLFGVLWRSADHGMDALPAHPVMQRWWAHMGRYHGDPSGQRAGCRAADPCLSHAMRHVAVLDIGKTNAKLALVDAQTRQEVEVYTRRNDVVPRDPYPHFDIDAIWAFVLDGLADIQARHGIDAISVTTHGASIVLLDEDGGLACPVLDYEHDGPEALAADYAALRPPFEETGSPRLPMGLNVGAQLHWLLETQDGLASRIGQVVTYPQFWSGRLTGRQGCEYTSLGCHTDLWLPHGRLYSPLVARLGLTGRMAPLLWADALAGPVLPEIARAAGLPEGTPVYSGIHDSNASLLPHLMVEAPPFTVVSTGTWVVAMAVGGAELRLDERRDVLLNVNARGEATPSARFMGGREYERMKHQAAESSAEDIRAVLTRRLFLLPSVAPSSGPFPGRVGGWSTPVMRAGQKGAALSFYLALMTATSLELIGARGRTIVEGPFARNGLYLDMLRAATGRPVAVSQTATGTSIGAALLAGGGAELPRAVPHAPGEMAEEMGRYALAWRTATSIHGS